MAREPQLITYDKWTVGEALKLTSTGTPSAWVPTLPIGVDDQEQPVVLAPNDYVKDVLLREYGNRIILEQPDLTDAQMIAAMKSCWENWWSTREHEYAFLADAFLREYSPIENYDRYEEGSIVDEHDIGARSGTDNLTDSYAATQHTKTETPRVETTVEDTFGASQRTETETPRAETTTTTTPGVKTTTTTTPGVVTTTENTVYGDNSSTDVPASKTTVTPNATNPDVVTVEYDSTTPDVVTVAGTDGTNTTVTAELQKIDSHVTSYDGLNTTVDADIARIDTHNRSTGSLAAKDTDTRTWDGYHVHGNIGVMTVADMLAKEVEIRSGIDLALMAIREWVDKFTFYAY